jgi:MerR family transcriptional regulator, thiopeptide resistance regulator
METIGRLARRCGLSRSTLLYYDRLGLVRAAARSAAGYRRYSAEDARRLELVCLYRSAGVPLADVRRILDGPRAALASALERRLAALQAEEARLRAQREVVVRLLRRPDAHRRRGLDKAGWVALLRAVGLDERAMDRWHAEFERMAPAAHQEFLASIGIPPAEARRIREAARGGGGAALTATALAVAPPPVRTPWRPSPPRPGTAPGSPGWPATPAPAWPGRRAAARAGRRRRRPLRRGARGTRRWPA